MYEPYDQNLCLSLGPGQSQQKHFTLITEEFQRFFRDCGYGTKGKSSRKWPINKFKKKGKD
jgi:hypothetical protein